uniref:TLC domain-containing protein n=1 Tax=Ditylum brightwellii TaxID=49249 RepID=A0A7S4RQH1_9STRA
MGKLDDFILFFSLIHHSLTLSLGLPTILRYRTLSTLHWICFELQAVAAVSVFIGEYTKILDVSKRDQLSRFIILSWVSFIMMLITRVFHWVYLVGEFIFVWYNDKAWGFLGIGSPFLLLFSFFNFAMVIKPMYGRLQKFTKVAAEHKSLPPDASEKMRSKSVRNLHLAASQVVDTTHLLNEEIVSHFVRRKVDRSQSMPAPAFKRMSMARGAKSLFLTRSLGGSQVFDFLAELEREREVKEE